MDQLRYVFNKTSSDSQSTTSSLTMESFSNLQSEVVGMQSRFDRMELLLEKMLVANTRNETDVSLLSTPRKAGGTVGASGNAS